MHQCNTVLSLWSYFHFLKHFKFAHLCIFCTRNWNCKNDRVLYMLCCISQGLAAFLKAIGYLIPLMDAEYANYYTREVMLILKREFQSPDEEMKKIVLKVSERDEKKAVLSYTIVNMVHCIFEKNLPLWRSGLDLCVLLFVYARVTIIFILEALRFIWF